ncbi:MAG: hypothetical protein O2946_12600, partial [Planctomycetota bacterium]|nr:hypothetical protein [Planctomycetota bacterium]
CSRAIMVSSLTQEGAPAATAAIFEGAFDVIAKPAGLPPHEAREFLSRQLVEKIAVVRAATSRARGLPVTGLPVWPAAGRTSPWLLMW